MEDAPTLELQGTGYRIILNGFDAHCSSKGYFCGAILDTGKDKYSIMFYDKVRLAQDIEDELISYGAFSEANIVVVPQISPDNFLIAMDYIIKFKDFERRFVPRRI
jgi:hypothetical protein